MPTTVVHVNDPGGYDVYIGRAVPRRGLQASPFANPFRIGRDGDREAVLRRYVNWLLYSEDRYARWAFQHARELRGKRLACWCAPERCHGDILAALADGAKASDVCRLVGLVEE